MGTPTEHSESKHSETGVLVCTCTQTGQLSAHLFFMCVGMYLEISYKGGKVC